jgi:hypothetical protein
MELSFGPWQSLAPLLILSWAVHFIVAFGATFRIRNSVFIIRHSPFFAPLRLCVSRRSLHDSILGVRYSILAVFFFSLSARH